MDNFHRLLLTSLFLLPAMTEAQQRPLSYYEDIKPIVDAYCKGCHSAGNIGPFPLTTYQEVYRKRFLMEQAVVDKVMPPWHAAPLHKYLYDISLPDDRIQLIQNWVQAGAAEGDPAAEGLAIHLDRGDIQSVDAELRLKEPYTTEVSRGDEYRCFLMDWEAEDEVFLKGYRFEFDNEVISHHAVLYQVLPKNLRKVQAMLDEDERGGYDCFGGPYTKGKVLPMPLVAIAGAGNKGFMFPGSTGIKLVKGTRLVLQMHYSVHGSEPQTDQTAVMLQLSRDKLKPGIYFPVMNVLWPFLKNTMKIPAGKDDVSHTYTGNPFSPFTLMKYFFPSDLNYRKGVTIYGVAPHMHLLGKSFAMNLVHPDKTKEPLLWVPHWDFHWQGSYFYETPISFGPKDKIELTCTWDNSGKKAGHVHPGSDGQEPPPPKDVYWGESTSDEMCTGALFVTEPD